MDFNGAVDDYNEAIEIEPGFAAAWYSRALIFEEFEQFGEAIRDYDQAIQVDPAHADALCARGMLFKRLGEGAFALADFNKCLESDPSMVEAWVEKARVLKSCGSLPQALACITKAIDCEGDPEFLQERAVIYMELGQPDLAYKDFSRYIAELNREDKELSGGSIEH